MLRILVLCARDWRHPRASGMERYAYEVFRRIAVQGHYVAWLCQSRGFRLIGSPTTTLERIDGIQVARLGSRILYRAMVGLFFSRLAKPGQGLQQFDVVVDFVDGRPFPVGKYTSSPTVPIVFHLAPGLRGSEDPPSPVIAPTEEAWLELRNAGVPKRHIIRAPFGVAKDAEFAGNLAAPQPFAIAATTRFRPLAHALQKLHQKGRTVEVQWHCPGKRRPRADCVRHSRALFDEEALREIPWFAYCGEGREWQAPAFTVRGIPVVCPDTPAGREFVRNRRNGFLHRPGDASHLAEVMERLLTDETVRLRMVRGAETEPHYGPWERSASLVLAVIENLCPADQDSLVTV